jgi:hypothetical protein
MTTLPRRQAQPIYKLYAQLLPWRKGHSPKFWPTFGIKKTLNYINNRHPIRQTSPSLVALSLSHDQSQDFYERNKNLVVFKERFCEQSGGRSNYQCDRFPPLPCLPAAFVLRQNHCGPTSRKGDFFLFLLKATTLYPGGIRSHDP